MGGGFLFQTPESEQREDARSATKRFMGSWRTTTAPTAAQEWTVNDMRLIDADALMERLGERARKHEYDECTELTIYEDMHEVKNAPTIDAVPVVRCQYCKYHNKAPCPMRLSLNWTKDKDFCSYGERKDGE